MMIDKNISEYIPKGRQNAIHQDELSNLLGIDAGTVKKLIQRERESGASIIDEKELFIVSGQCGYWLTDNITEVREYIRKEEGQAIKRFNTNKAYKRAINEYEGQLSINED